MMEDFIAKVQRDLLTKTIPPEIAQKRVVSGSLFVGQPREMRLMRCVLCPARGCQQYDR